MTDFRISNHHHSIFDLSLFINIIKILSPPHSLMVFPSILAIIVASIAAMVVGFIWYSEPLFGKQWMQLLGMTQAQAEAGMKQGMLVGIAATIIFVTFLGVLMNMASVSSLSEALTFGLVFCLASYIPVQMHHKAWAQQPTKLITINGASQVVMALVVCVILFWLG
jgi:hypothetical protein